MDEKSERETATEDLMSPAQEFMQKQSETVGFIHHLFSDQMDSEETKAAPKPKDRMGKG